MTHLVHHQHVFSVRQWPMPTVFSPRFTFSQIQIIMALHLCVSVQVTKAILVLAVFFRQAVLFQ